MNRMNIRFDDVSFACFQTIPSKSHTLGFYQAKRKYEAQIEAQKTVLDKYASQFSEFHALLADQRKQQATMKAEYDATLADLRAKNAEALQQQVETIKTDYKCLETSAQARYETMLAHLCFKHREALQSRTEAMKADYQHLENTMRAQYEAASIKDGEALRQQAESIKAEYNGQLTKEIRRLEVRLNHNVYSGFLYFLGSERR